MCGFWSTCSVILHPCMNFSPNVLKLYHLQLWKLASNVESSSVGISIQKKPMKLNTSSVWYIRMCILWSDWKVIPCSYANFWPSFILYCFQLWKLVCHLLLFKYFSIGQNNFAFEVLYLCQILIDFCETKSVLNSKICTFPAFGII